MLVERRGRRSFARPRRAPDLPAHAARRRQRDDAHLISGGTLTLFEHADQRARHRAAIRRSIPGAVEECLRWVTPIQAFARTVTADTEIGGCRSERGRLPRAALRARATATKQLFGPTANAFDIRRDSNPPHLAFGFGEHLCLGAASPHGDPHPLRGAARPAPQLRRGRRAAVGSVEPRARNGLDAARLGR